MYQSDCTYGHQLSDQNHHGYTKYEAKNFSLRTHSLVKEKIWVPRTMATYVEAVHTFKVISLSINDN